MSLVKTYDDQKLSKGVMISIIIHAIFFAGILIYDFFATPKVINYIPSIKVDLVGLPDLRKNDVGEPKGVEASKEVKVEKPVPKEDKIVEKKVDVEKAVPINLNKKTEKDRKKEMSNALKKLQALSKIEESLAEQKPKKGQKENKRKGNFVSQGGASFGDVNGRSDPYLDSIMERLKSNWQLPQWLLKKNFSAEVVVYIDHKGNVRTYSFRKKSGNDQFDSYVQQALKKSDPFMAPPEELRKAMSNDGLLVGFPL